MPSPTKDGQVCLPYISTDDTLETQCLWHVSVYSAARDADGAAGTGEGRRAHARDPAGTETTATPTSCYVKTFSLVCGRSPSWTNWSRGSSSASQTASRPSTSARKSSRTSTRRSPTSSSGTIRSASGSSSAARNAKRCRSNTTTSSSNLARYTQGHRWRETERRSTFRQRFAIL